MAMKYVCAGLLMKISNYFAGLKERGFKKAYPFRLSQGGSRKENRRLFSQTPF